MGGMHITALPECLPTSSVAACLGEGELTFVDIVKTFLEGKFTPESLADITGISFWNDGIIQHNKKRSQMSELDYLPMPARDLLTIQPHTYMFTSRGCPYRCAFCASSRFWDKLRFFSAEYVVDEIELLLCEYQVSMISFFDDLFAANRLRLEEIIRLLERRRLLGKVQYTCSCRANMVDVELVQLLSRMGIVSVGLGLESGDEETLHFLKGQSISVSHNELAINLFKKAKIAVNGSFIIGSPSETREQIMHTYDFIRHSKLDLFDIYLLTPYPGTPVWDYAVQCGLVYNDMPDWSCLDVNTYRFPEKAIILSEVLEKKEVIRLYKKFRYLRIRRNLKKVLNHPMRQDLPRMGLKLFKENVYSQFR